MLQGEKPNLGSGFKSSNAAYKKSDVHWKSEDGKKSLFLMDFLASRYGWSIEYIDELDECFIDNLLLNSRKRSHYTYVSDEEDEYDDMAIDFEKGEWQDTDEEIGARLKKLDIKEKPKRDYNVADRMQNREMATSICSGSEQAKGEMKSVIEINKSPAAQKLHAEYDELHELLNSPRTSKAQKNSVAGRMAKIALELDQLGAVLKYGR